MAQAEILADAAPAPSFAEAVRAWARIGVLSFGGPAAQIALMHRVVVEEKRWLSEQRYLHALSFCMLLPGPEAMQLATYAGWRLHGVFGGLAAGLLFVLPGALVVLALAAVYAAFGAVPLVAALFLGVKAAVLAIVLEALLRISRRALKRRLDWALAAASFVAIFFLGLPFPLIVAAAALAGAMAATRTDASEAAVAPSASAGRSARDAALWLAIWLTPLLALSAMPGAAAEMLAALGWFFSKLAVVTFGGAYAVLAYMGQEVVAERGWLDAAQMIDALGLAETTPGPLILVTEFVGFLAAYQHGDGSAMLPAWLLGVLGALTALWATFAPCFLWIFVGAPYVEWLNARPRLRAALAGVIAAVVGVIANLALWFALHVFFASVTLREVGPLSLWTPELATLDLRAVGLAAISAVLLLRLHWSAPAALGAAAGLALAMQQAAL